MTICDEIRAARAQVRVFFDELAPLVGDDRRASAASVLLARLALAIKAEAAAEQKVLHLALRGGDRRLTEVALQARHEDHALELLVDKLLAVRPGADARAVLAVARRLFDARCAHEQREVWPVLAAHLPPIEAAHLARDLAAERQRLHRRFALQAGIPARAA